MYCAAPMATATTNRRGQERKAVLVRLPLDLYDRFTAIADSEHRTYTAQANLAIEAHVKEYENGEGGEQQ